MNVWILSLTLLTSTFFASPVQANSQPAVGDHTLQILAKTYERAPVDARTDRVWRCIPGLCGRKLDTDASRLATAMAHDDKLHVKWVNVPPSVRLSNLPPNPIYRATNAEKSVCLMFNVSWGEAYVPSLLRTLEHAGVSATFFLDGAWVKAHPDLAKAIVAGGHTVGSHGTGHPDFQRLSEAALRRQVLGTNQVIQNTVGVKTELLAPPGGSFDERTVRVDTAAKMYTILWTVDSIDWRKPPASTIVTRVLGKIEPGALVLMHPTKPTAEALPTLIQTLKNRGYQFKTVAQVVHEEPAVIPPSTLSQ
jgi:probable sporulation protein (polysaccharide deacetylase family)